MSGMRKVRLGQIIESMTFDLKRMEKTGVSVSDIAHYLKRKSVEVGSHIMR